MKILLADSGSTKTEWSAVETDGRGCVVSQKSVLTQGINPVHQDDRYIADVLSGELLPQLEVGGRLADEVFFYGAGCVGAYAERLKGLLRSFAGGGDTSVEVASDMLAAARALCGHKEGVAAILGTGANSCYYDGTDIVENVPPLGYILGDEGSGAVLGKMLVNALLKGDLSSELREEFYRSTSTTYSLIIDKVYRQPLANRFLASLSPFVAEHRHVEGVRSIVVDNFTAFVRKNIAKYRRPDLPVNAIGSIAFYFADELRQALESEGYVLGKVVRAPMQGLIAFHAGAERER